MVLYSNLRQIPVKSELDRWKMFENDSINNHLTNKLESIIPHYLTDPWKCRTNQILWRNNLVTKTLISSLKILICILFYNLMLHSFIVFKRRLNTSLFYFRGNCIAIKNASLLFPWRNGCTTSTWFCNFVGVVRK